MTPVSRNLTVYRGIDFTFFFILRDDLSLIDTFTVNTTTDVVTTATPHGLSAGDPVQFSNNGGGLPAPIETGVDYWVITTPTSASFTFSTTYNGIRFDIQSAGTGTNSVYTKRPVDLTGWSVWAWVKSTPTGTIIFDIDPQISSPATQGKIDLSQTRATTVLLTAGDYLWDLILERPDTTRIGPLFAGGFQVIHLNTEPP